MKWRIVMAEVYAIVLALAVMHSDTGRSLVIR